MNLHPSDDIGLLYRRIRGCARQIAARFPAPEFYTAFPREHAFSRRFFEFDPVVQAIRRVAIQELSDDFGHGLPHADKVSLDAGALLIIECRRAGFPLDRIRRWLRLAHCAGLIHDIRRKEADHAVAGFEYARRLLRPSGLFTPSDVDALCGAILNHEAFKKTAPMRGVKARMISNCLYDADKFRWGCDNFTDTVWLMVTHLRMPFPDFLARYPAGMAKIANIKETFRTDAGKSYGPSVIDTGLSVGRILYERLRHDFRHRAAP